MMRSDGFSNVMSSGTGTVLSMGGIEPLRVTLSLYEDTDGMGE